MNRRLNLHSCFFSSLKQVEKRLKLVNSLQQNDHHSSQSIISPLYLHTDHLHNLNSVANQSTNLEYSETPVEFLSNSFDFPQTHEKPPPESPQFDPQTLNCVDNEVDEIGLLIELLGLSVFEEDVSETGTEEMQKTCGSCHCEDGFLNKIVGVKGPKCGKEMERLEGWIKHYRTERIEPLRLAHLLLGKAACVVNDDGNSGGYLGVEFSCTVEEFLRHDPPTLSKDEGRSSGY